MPARYQKLDRAALTRNEAVRELDHRLERALDDLQHAIDIVEEFRFPVHLPEKLPLLQARCITAVLKHKENP